MTAHRFSRGQGAFSLIEVLVVTSMLGIIIVPLSASIIVGLKTTDDTESSLRTSFGRQFLSIYLPPDVESATSIDDTSSPVNSGCSGTDPGTHVLRLRGVETVPPQETETVYVAEYRKVQVSPPGVVPAEYELVRVACEEGGAPIQNVVARSLHEATAALGVAPTDPDVAVTLTDTEDAVYTVSASRRTL